MLVIVISEDKLTLSMFSSFFRKYYCNDIIIKELNSLFDSLYQQFIINTSFEESLKGRNILIRYKVKSSLFISPDVEKADILVKFEGLYSISPTFLRSNIEMIDEIELLNKWKLFAGY